MKIVVTIATNGARLVLCSEQQGAPANAVEAAVATVVHQQINKTITLIGQTMDVMQVGRTEIAKGAAARTMKDETLNGPPVGPIARTDPEAN